MGFGNESKVTEGHYTLRSADNLGATGDDAVWDITQPITVQRIGTIITTVMSGAATVKFDRRILTDSDTGRGDGDVGVLTVPDLTAVGKVVYKDVAVDLNPGDQIVAEVTAAATSGAGRYFFEYVPRAETAGNLTDMVASA